jgi:hypothetical protein
MIDSALVWPRGEPAATPFDSVGSPQSTPEGLAEWRAGPVQIFSDASLTGPQSPQDP